MSSSTSHRPQPELAPAAAPTAAGTGPTAATRAGGGGGGGGGKTLIKIAFARNQAEAEMLQGLLGEAGIPSVLKAQLRLRRPRVPVRGPP